MKHLPVIIIVIVVAIVAIVLLLQPSQPSGGSGPTPYDIGPAWEVYGCQSDDDCAPSGCCGWDECRNKDHLEDCSLVRCPYEDTRGCTPLECGSETCKCVSGSCTPQEVSAECGDGFCVMGEETCASCPEDCGECEGVDYRTPLMSCTICDRAEELSPEMDCCTDAFDNDCASQGGAVRWVDGHPGPYDWKECYKKAPDAGKACASGGECLTMLCDLQVAVDEARCTLVDKTVTGANEYDGSEFYIATYACTTNKPGKCLESLPNGVNPGGTSHTFTMDGTQLTEVRESGPIM